MVKAFEFVSGIFVIIAALFYNLGHLNSCYVASLIASLFLLLALIAYRKERKDKERVTLQIKPLMSSLSIQGSNFVDTVAIEILNLSAFPVTVSQVGLTNPLGKLIVIPILLDGEPFPRRLEPRAKFSVYFDPSFIKEPSFKENKEVFVETQCNHTFRQSLENIHKWGIT